MCSNKHATLCLICGADIFVPLEDPTWKRIRNHSNSHTLDLMQASAFNVAYAPCICVNRILLRRSAQTESIIQDWLHWCSQEDVIRPLPDAHAHPLSLFHTPEQSILAILLRKREVSGDLPLGWPFLSYAPGFGRVFRLDSLEAWPQPFWRNVFRRLRFMLDFILHFDPIGPLQGCSPFGDIASHSFWSQFPRVSRMYLLKLACRGFFMCFVPFPRVR